MRVGTLIGRALGYSCSVLALLLALRGVPHECHTGHEDDGSKKEAYEEACLICALLATPFLPQEARSALAVPAPYLVCWAEEEFDLARTVRQPHLARGPPQS